MPDMGCPHTIVRILGAEQSVNPVQTTPTPTPTQRLLIYPPRAGPVLCDTLINETLLQSVHQSRNFGPLFAMEACELSHTLVICAF